MPFYDDFLPVPMDAVCVALVRQLIDEMQSWPAINAANTEQERGNA